MNSEFNLFGDLSVDLIKELNRINHYVAKRNAQQLINLLFETSDLTEYYFNSLFGKEYKKVAAKYKKQIEFVKSLKAKFAESQIDLEYLKPQIIQFTATQEYYSEFPLYLSESDVQEKLNKIVKGKREIKCDMGRIDILSQVEIIEVKQVKKWRDTLGQIYGYHFCYPNHSLRIHLFFREPKDVLLYKHRKDIIEKIAGSLNIRVTWET